MLGTLTILAATLPTLLLATAVAGTRTAGGPTTSWSHTAATPENEWASFCHTLLKLYGLFAFAVVVLVAIETRAGMFEGLTIGESILKATGADVLDGVSGQLM
jgi:hypothetical protein